MPTTPDDWLRYLRAKRHELRDLGLKDVVLAKAVADIHRKRSRCVRSRLALRELHPIHRLDRPTAAAALRRRRDAIAARRAEILSRGSLDRAQLQALMPSVSGIKVVTVAPGEHVCFEGNGRLAALVAALGTDAAVTVEVERYLFTSDAAKILRRVARVRRLNRLREERPTRT